MVDQQGAVVARGHPEDAGIPSILVMSRLQDSPTVSLPPRSMSVDVNRQRLVHQARRLASSFVSRALMSRSCGTLTGAPTGELFIRWRAAKHLVELADQRVGFQALGTWPSVIRHEQLAGHTCRLEARWVNPPLRCASSWAFAKNLALHGTAMGCTAPSSCLAQLAQTQGALNGASLQTAN
jgi:hypothetical protein